MTRITKGIAANALATLCIAMQIMVILPHHHHEGSNAPCVNVLHCTDSCSSVISSCCGQDHDGSHHRHGDPDASHSHDANDPDCAYNHLDAVRLDRERASGLADLAVSMLAEIAFDTLLPSHCADCDKVIVELDRKRLRSERSIHTDYITEATPPRAPSLTV